MSLIDDFSRINFSELEAEDVERLIITGYENATQTTLYPGDPVRLFLETQAYLFTLLIHCINLVGNQQVLVFAVGEHEDLIGQMVGTSRLPACAASTSLRFTLREPADWPVSIPQGTRANPSGDAKLTFATDETTFIPAGALYVDVSATCLVVGEQGNGMLPGQINRLVPPIAYVAAVANTETSRLGADVEDGAHYKKRVQLAPEAFSCAGPHGAYRKLALSAHQGIADVGVFSPMAGTVDVRPIMKNGELPTEDVLQKVKDILSGDSVRPMTDNLIVAAPDPVPYTIDGEWWLHKDNAALAASIRKKVDDAENEFRTWQSGKPGRDINPTRLTALLERAGAKRVKLATPTDVTLAESQIAQLTSSRLVFRGIEDD